MKYYDISQSITMQNYISIIKHAPNVFMNTETCCTVFYMCQLIIGVLFASTISLVHNTFLLAMLKRAKIITNVI